MLTPKDGRGVSCLAGRDDLSLLAWSDLGPEPAVHVYQYAAPAKIKNMEGRTGPEKTMQNHLLALLYYVLLLGHR